MKELRYCFRALSDASRFRIVHELADRDEMKVSDLARLVRVSQPLLSWHLRKLRRAGLIITRRDGRQVFCSLNRAQFRLCEIALSKLAGPAARAEWSDILS
ncbi:MAG: metalloregulator ArsR/SmtB family transcription factor [Chloroflexi bacterium]|nr:metalloregulator ArsR/SmtB family transcription factor [Chloroflexota bacterium]MDA8189536.1 metalloregulator ArsR/SmtB family transcription factor [Dehalococcoidales bacterium]